MACAMPTRRSMPPDSVRSLRPRLAAQADPLDRGRHRGRDPRPRGISLSSAKYSTNSATVKPG